MVDNNSGLYEGSTIATVAIAIIPVILWLARFGSVYPRDWRVRLFAYALIFPCLVIPVGTQARPGLVCARALAVLVPAEAGQRVPPLRLVPLPLAISLLSTPHHLPQSGRPLVMAH